MNPYITIVYIHQFRPMCVAFGCNYYVSYTLLLVIYVLFAKHMRSKWQLMMSH